MCDSLEIEIPVDDDGFVPRQCPACRKRFKARPTRDGSDAPRFCPYCRFEPGGDAWQPWFTDTQRSHFDEVTEARARDVVARILRISSGAPPSAFPPHATSCESAPREPLSASMPDSRLTCRICRSTVKHDDSTSSVYCIACGERFDLAREDTPPRTRRRKPIR
jgi:hypothetical protein